MLLNGQIVDEIDNGVYRSFKASNLKFSLIGQRPVRHTLHFNEVENEKNGVLH